LVGRTFQAALPENMYVFPVDESVRLPALWARWTEPAESPISVPANEISEHRSEWIREWSDVTAR